MFDFIPLPSYTAVYHHVLFAVAFLILFQSLVLDIRDPRAVKTASLVGYVLLVLVILYMGLRPVSGVYFGDMGTYSAYFTRIQQGERSDLSTDILFNYFILFSTKFMGAKQFFLLVAFLYTVPCYLFSRKYFGSYWFFGFFMFIGSFSFWAYGTNGMRNGLATAVFLMALVQYDRKWLMYPLMAVGVGIHSSLIIPFAAFAVSLLIKNPRQYLLIWLAAIPLSLLAGSALQNIFAGFYTADERALDYLTKGNTTGEEFSSTGFRWDFVMYSAAAVYAGWYYIFKKNISDRFYLHLFGTYVIANAFWILMIRANFSNRFAYLSWFLMAAVIAYPMFRYRLWNDQYRTAGIILFAYYGFTYFMFLIT